jgi:hypothetical protein
VTLHPDVERLALLGWRLFPSTRSQKAMFKHYLGAATSDLAVITAWSQAYPGCNWSVVPEGSGVWALDVDVPSIDHAADGVAALRALCAEHGALPRRPHGRSGGGGHLLVFRDAGHRIRAKTGTPAPGIDPRAGRVTFTVAPSLHRHGGRYCWLVPPWDLEPPVAPQWLLDRLAPPSPPALPRRAPNLTDTRARRTLMRAADAVQNARPGHRNAVLNQQAFTIGGLIGAGMLDETLAATALYHAGRYAGLDDAETKATIRSGLVAGARHPLDRRRDA